MNSGQEQLDDSTADPLDPEVVIAWWMDQWRQHGGPRVRAA